MLNPGHVSWMQQLHNLFTGVIWLSLFQGSGTILSLILVLFSLLLIFPMTFSLPEIKVMRFFPYNHIHIFPSMPKAVLLLLILRTIQQKTRFH